MILEIASAFLHKAAYINNHSVHGAIVSFTELMDSLDRDGFAMVGENLRARDEVIDVDQEVSRFEQTLQEGPHDRKDVVQHHLQQAELHYANHEWGAAAGEWRHVFEESLRGAWRLTRVEMSILLLGSRSLRSEMFCFGLNKPISCKQKSVTHSEQLSVF